VIPGGERRLEALCGYGTAASSAAAGLLGAVVVVRAFFSLLPPEPVAALALSTPAAVPASPAPPPVTPVPELPRGKGMWIHRLEWAAGGDPVAVADQARAVGLTHLYLRLGSSKDGFYGQGDLDRLLPVAHAAGLKVVGWDFPYLDDPADDAERAAAEITYTTPSGQRIDAFSADIESPQEGVRLTTAGADAYSAKLRERAGPSYPLVATVPRPSPFKPFPYAEVVRHFDAVAPMVYWMNRDPVADVTGAIAALAPLGKPVLPVGQAYDGGPEGGPQGPPPKEAVVRFMQAATASGATGFSFWVWQTATPDHWAAIKEASP
jgi:hypothetical protein